MNRRFLSFAASAAALTLLTPRGRQFLRRLGRKANDAAHAAADAGAKAAAHLR